MKTRKLLSAVLLAASIVTGGYVIYTSQKEVELSDLAKANVEALASSESTNCAEWTKKSCYTVFTTEYGQDYYATCPETSVGGVGECGAIETHRPAGITLIHECLECVREYQN